MTNVALQMLLYSPGRAFVAILGTTVAFFLSSAQIGMMLGWSHSCTGIIRQADRDLWVIPRHTVAFDYGTEMPRNRLYQVRSVPGIQQADPLFMGWLFWQRPNGRHDNIELIGLDAGMIGGPSEMRQGSLNSIFSPDSVVVDEMYLKNLGVSQIGDEFEIAGRKAVVRGICRGVRTITAAPFVFTSLETALKYDARYREDEITYVMAKVIPGEEVSSVAVRIEQAIPSVEALTSNEFTLRTIRYWMLETGLGITVVLTAILGLVVGAVVISQTLYAITNDHLSHYATLMAIGVSRTQITSIVIVQSLFLGMAGTILGTGLLYAAAQASNRSPVLILLTREAIALNVFILLFCCLAASYSSLRAVRRLDPVVVFKA